MGLRDKITKAYLKSPTARMLDPVVKRRKSIKSEVSRRGEKGGKIVKELTSRIFNNPKKRRRKRYESHRLNMGLLDTPGRTGKPL